MGTELQLEQFCELISVAHTHPPIPLPNLHPVIIGRGPLTRITDKKCSREQAEVRADFKKQEVTVKQLGLNPSKVVGHVLKKEESYVLGPGGSFELLEGHYKCYVHFGQRIPEHVQRELKAAEEDGGKVKGRDKEKQELGGQAARLGKKRHMSPENEEGSPLTAEDSTPIKQAKLDVDVPTSSSSLTAPLVRTKRLQKSLDVFYGAKGRAPVADRLKSDWKEVSTLIVFRYGPLLHSSKLAAFDLDTTLIDTASGKKFPTGPTDWKFMKNVVNRLRSLEQDGFRIVIVSNQLGIRRGKPSKQDFRQKMEAIASQLGVPLLLLASTSRDVYRKPCVGMWTHLVTEENGGLEADTEESFFVGDAAGREANWRPGAKKDFSCTDRKFAANLGLTFLTPEEYFLGYPTCTMFTWGEFDPRSLDYTRTEPKLLPEGSKLTSERQEVLLLVGCPASGKSSFYATYLKVVGYSHINRDTLGSWQKCAAECTKLLRLGRSVVVDNTNPDKESRQRYIKCAQDLKVPVRCFWFTASVAHARHNNRFRELTVKDASYKKVTDMVFNIYKSKFCEPDLSEGLEEIVRVSFTPRFHDEKSAKLYRQFLD